MMEYNQGKAVALANILNCTGTCHFSSVHGGEGSWQKQGSSYWHPVSSAVTKHRIAAPNGNSYHPKLHYQAK